MNDVTPAKRRGRRGRQDAASASPEAKPNGAALKNPFPVMTLFSEDFIEEMHESALRILEDMGIMVLLDEAVGIYRKGGAQVAEDGQTVHIGRDMVEAALATAPKSITMRGGARHRDIELALGNLVFQPGAGAPYVNDRERGRRPGSLEDFRELVQITHHFDALHMIPPLVESQDVPMHLRHYAMLEAELTLTDKVPFIFSRGTPQVEESFEMMRDFRGLSDDEFMAAAWCYTIINTNSPRQLDIPMAQGLIDFARAAQVSIITPFTLMGAMAPITVAGAITLSHAEALAAITLTQLTRPGAPVCYGTFTSNVDMKSGAPAFGTPEHFRASVAAGQLARKIGLPWRSASGSAANINDAQAANETQLGTWGCLLGGATVVIHAAGWQEGGLTVGYEKLITDMEVVNMIADLCRNYEGKTDDIGLDAIAGIAPGGHFFGCDHTMARYRTEFYEHIVADLSNFGTWTENGAIDTHTRATGVWKSILEADVRPELDEDRVAALTAYIAKRTEAGGAAPVS